MPRKPKTNRAQSALHKERQLIVERLGRNPSYGCLSRVAKELNTTPYRCYYWYRKSFDPHFHASSRNIANELSTFCSWELPQVYVAVVDFLKTNPTADLSSVCSHLTERFLRRVTKPVASRVLKKMGWSWKVPTTFQVAKYSLANMERYVAFLEWIQSIDDWTRLKFCDESHIIPRKLSQRKVLGIVNQRVYNRDSALQQPAASVSLITSLALNGPIFFDYREQSNTQWDFVEFVLSACENGFLQSGDFLIADNAAVHGGSASLDVLCEILHTFGVELVFLPAYSPELNPCELVFSLMKGSLRKWNPTTNPDILNRVVSALAGVTLRHILSFYCHCIYPKNVLPDLTGALQ